MTEAYIGAGFGVVAFVAWLVASMVLKDEMRLRPR
jgi:hypothetical protein